MILRAAVLSPRARGARRRNAVARSAPAIRPITFSSTSMAAFRADEGSSTSRSPTTTVGGINAAATAIPARISEISLVSARMIANPRISAMMT